MDNIKSQLDNLPELSDESVSELEQSIITQFDTFSEADLSTQTVDAMTELADMLDTIRGEVSRREAQAEELAVRAAEASSRVRGESEPVDSEAPAEESGEDDEEDEEPIEASAATEVEVAEESETPATEPATEASIEEAEVETVVEAEAAIEEVAETVETPEVEAVVESEASAEDEVVEAPVETATEASADVEASEEDAPAVAEFSAEDESSDEAEAPVEAEASNIEETPNELDAQEEAQTVTASAEESFEAPASRRPQVQATEAPVAITAGADIPGVTAGSKLASKEDVAKAFSDRLHTLRRVSGGDGEQHTVASFTTEYPVSHILDGTPQENWEKIEKSGEERQAIVASGGYGTPLETRYDIFGFGTDERPVKASLPRFQADRGGIRFVKPPVLSSYTAAIGIWTEALDIEAASNTGTDDTLKNVLVVDGATEDTAGIDAVTLQLQIGNLLARAYPELVARHNELALIQHARQAEINLLNKIEAASTAVTTTSTIGVARDFLVNVRRAAAAYRSRHRIAPDTRLQAIIPMWVIDAMAADLALSMPGDDNLSVARSEVVGWLSALNVSLTESYDLNTFGTQGTGALVEFGDTFKWFLFSEGSFLFLDGGTLDIGIVRDSSLVSVNDYRMFVETFEGLAFVGIESLAITSTIAVNGAAAALVSPVDY